LARTSKLQLVGGTKPQLRKKAPRKGSKARANEFIKVLAETCNVSEACRRSGLPMTVAYRRRNSDAAFRAQWADAIASSYQRLELALLGRAFNGTEKVIRRRDGSEDRMLEYPNHLGLQLLKLHRGTAVGAISQRAQENIDQAREQLLNKLLRLKRRMGQE
jgi:hypothetical protein